MSDCRLFKIHRNRKIKNDLHSSMRFVRKIFFLPLAKWQNTRKAKNSNGHKKNRFTYFQFGPIDTGWSCRKSDQFRSVSEFLADLQNESTAYPWKSSFEIIIHKANLFVFLRNDDRPTLFCERFKVWEVSLQCMFVCVFMCVCVFVCVCLCVCLRLWGFLGPNLNWLQFHLVL